MLIVPLCLSACGVDRWAGYAEKTKTDRWIDSLMRERYLWNDRIPDFNKLNYFQAPATFFKALLAQEDKLSAIDSLPSVAVRSIADTRYSYGIQYSMFGPMYNDTAYFARVDYVAHHSPAELAGLQRGDWIMEMNGGPVTRKNYVLLSGSGAVTLTVGSYDIPTDSVIARETPVPMGAACAITDNPVYYNKVYQRADKRIGYLVYNRCTFGADPAAPDNRPYDRDLLDASNTLAAAGAAGGDFILDLRYNDGGDMACAELLCTLLAPAGALGEVLGYAQYNDRIGTTTLTLDPARITGGTNLNVQTLYVLTGTQTAAAAELIINCLKPYMSVVLVGQKSAGQTLYTERYANPELLIRITPVVCRLFNSDNSSDYAGGFTPDYLLNPDDYPAYFLPLGDERELLLGTALSLIDGSYTAQ
jgi:C-terminal processing protease CtpA/Prc